MRESYLPAHPNCSDQLSVVCVLVSAVEGRSSLLNISLKEVSLDPGCDLAEVAKLTEGYSGADITNLCRSVSVHALSNLCTRARE